MESNEEKKGREGDTYIKREKPKSILTKENFFDLLKPTAGTQVLLESGDHLTSAPVLEIIGELKQYMEKKDPDGFRRFVHTDPKREALTRDERILILETVITEKGYTVHTLLDWLQELNIEERRRTTTKENFFERFKPLPDIKFFTENEGLLDLELEPEPTSGIVLVRELRRCMESKDVDGFRALLDGPMYESLSDDEQSWIWEVELTENRRNVGDLVREIDDLFKD